MMNNWTVPGCLLAYFVSWHLVWISNWIVATILNFMCPIYIIFFDDFFETLQKWYFSQWGCQPNLHWFQMYFDIQSLWSLKHMFQKQCSLFAQQFFLVNTLPWCGIECLTYSILMQSCFNYGELLLTVLWDIWSCLIQYLLTTWCL
jgi:hypothetical protein